MSYPTRSKAIGALPVTGAVCAQYVRRNGKRFGPYWFLFYREGGKLCKKYVPKDRVDAVRRDCDGARAERKARAARNLESREALSALRCIRRCLSVGDKLETGQPLTDAEVRWLTSPGGAGSAK